MARRPIEPEEAIDPVLDGLEEMGLSGVSADWTPLEEGGATDPDLMEEPETDAAMTEPRLLVFGQDPDAAALVALASPCGFKIQIVAAPGETIDNSLVDKVVSLDNFEGVVGACDIGRDTFVCVFLEDEVECELILTQCLASDASYIGVSGNHEKLEAIYNALKADGAPDAELAAIAAPMGLNIGAETPEQQAVAIMAEMLAAKAGKLKKLRYGRARGWKGGERR